MDILCIYLKSDWIIENAFLVVAYLHIEPGLVEFAFFSTCSPWYFGLHSHGPKYACYIRF